MVCSLCGNKNYTMNPSYTLSAEKLKNLDVLTMLRFAYAVSPANFVATFKSHGISINSDEDLVLLSDIQKNGADIRQGFSVLSILAEVKTTNEQVVQAGKEGRLTFIK